MRHALETIEKVKALRRQGLTLTEIIAETNLPKNTIFHHIQKIAMSDEFKARMLVANLATMKRLADNRRGRSFKRYPHWEPTQWSPGFVNLVAHFMFDGEIRKTSLVYNNRSRALIDNVISLMEELIGVSDYILYIDKNGVMRASYHNVEITNFLRRKESELLEYISGASDGEKIAFFQVFIYIASRFLARPSRLREKEVTREFVTLAVYDFLQGIFSCGVYCGRVRDRVEKFNRRVCDCSGRLGCDFFRMG